MFLLSALAAYDFLTLTARLYHWSCFLLAIGVGVAFTRWASAREESVLRFARRTFMFAVAAWCIALFAVRGGIWLEEKRELASLPQASPGAPNVLVIVVDTLRADHLSSYGYARPTSPNIDRIAQQGTLFENAISACSWSLPSHVSLMTGLYQFQHGVTNVQPMPVFGSGAEFQGSAHPGGSLRAPRIPDRSFFREPYLVLARSWFRARLCALRRLFSFSCGHVGAHALWARVLAHLFVAFRPQQTKTSACAGWASIRCSISTMKAWDLTEARQVSVNAPPK